MATERTHTYGCRLEWKAAPGKPTTDPKNYPREHTVSFEGKPSIRVSAAPEYQGDAGATNPEELFAAALASCQMLTYLALAGRAGIEVRSYRDDALATLQASPGMKITRVDLRPKIVVAAGADMTKAEEMIEKAHKYCFIANSVSCEVQIRGEVTSAG